MRHLIALPLLCVLLTGCATTRPTSSFSTNDRYPILLAHRGIAQTFPRDGVGGDTCTASRIRPPTHQFLENTIASMRAAIAAGADVIELDVHPTTDGEFAVFHDWTLDCRTEGRGRTRDQSMTYLRTLDAGYGYTADGGKTFPLRGKGVGAIPSLRDVLAAYPSDRLLINVKSNDAKEGELLASFLATLPSERRRRLAVYGGEIPVAKIRDNVPEVLTLTRDAIKTCLIQDMFAGWATLTPKACERRLLVIPINYEPWLWGWPHRFVERMNSVGSAVYVIGEQNTNSAAAIDTEADLKRLPARFRGGIWTDEIEHIGKVIRTRVQNEETTSGAR